MLKKIEVDTFIPLLPCLILRFILKRRISSPTDPFINQEIGDREQYSLILAIIVLKEIGVIEQLPLFRDSGAQRHSINRSTC